MIEIDGTVSDYQGLASNGRQNHTSDGISDEGKGSGCLRCTNVSIDAVVSKTWSSV